MIVHHNGLVFMVILIKAGKKSFVFIGKRNKLTKAWLHDWFMTEEFSLNILAEFIEFSDEESVLIKRIIPRTTNWIAGQSLTTQTPRHVWQTWS